MSIANPLILTQPHELQELIRVAIAGEFEKFLNQGKVPYYSQLSSENTGKLLKRKEVAQRLRRSSTWVSMQIHKGKLAGALVNGQYIISETEIQRFIKDNQL